MPKRGKSVQAKRKNQKETPTKTPKRLARLRPRRRPKPEAPPKKLTGSFRLFADSASLLRQHWKLFSGITLVYLILSIVLVGVLNSKLNVIELKQTFSEQLGQLSASIALFGILLGSGGKPGSESGAAYQTIVILMVSLATIWALRQVLAGKKVSVRDAFYKGMYPLVPFVLVLLFLCVEFIPAVAGVFILSTVFGGGLAATFIEQALWATLIFFLATLSIYLISSTAFALYIVTLPDVRPMEAIKTARRLVKYRRWSIIRKLLFLPLAFLVIGAVVLLPLIMFVPALVMWVFMILSMLALVFAHTYAYGLYKELL